MGLLSAGVGEERGQAAKPRENLLLSHRLFVLQLCATASVSWAGDTTGN